MQVDLSGVQRCGELMQRIANASTDKAIADDFGEFGAALAAGEGIGARAIVEGMAAKGDGPVFGSEGVGAAVSLAAADMFDRLARHEVHDETDSQLVRAVKDHQLEEECRSVAGDLRRLARSFQSADSFEAP